MVEPFYIRQSAEHTDPDAQYEWMKLCASEAQAEGAKFCRFSRHPELLSLVLVECWRESMQEVGDQGQQRFSVIPNASKC